MRGLRDSVVVITGGCGDLGRATARRLASESARVVLLDLLEGATGRDVAQQVGASAYYRCDQSDREEVDDVLSRVWGRFGRLDVAIANAAIVRRALFQDISRESWDEYLKVNLTGYFHIAQAAVRIMLEQAPGAGSVRGKVLFTSSWTAQHPLPGNVPYVVTKAAVEAMARAMAQELAMHGIRVNALAPGLVYAGLTRELCEQTPGFRENLLEMVPLGELGTPEQVADAYAFLCSGESDYMTGQVLTVDGGCSVIKRQLPT
jgi:NAD(P)-dependent dehydrogenase (short-subunit alcohol dehydrogenase family)